MPLPTCSTAVERDDPRRCRASGHAPDRPSPDRRLNHIPPAWRSGLMAALCASLLAACASPPRQPSRTYNDAPRAPAARAVTDISVYPGRGQTPATLRRDRYECNAWAVRESGFDPATARFEPTPVPRVEADPPSGAGLAAGAVTGAVIGAVVGSPYHSGQGAAIGAVVGGAAGAASDASREARAARVEDAYADRAARRDGAASEQASRYRRALIACLEGRGYAVR